MKQWWVVDIWKNGQYVYLGKCQATLEEIRTHFKWTTIVGNNVRIYDIQRNQ